MSSAYSPPSLADIDRTPDTKRALFFKVTRDDVIVRLAPTRKTRRRGVVVKDSILPLLDTAKGPDCQSEWVRVHTDGWICGDLGDIVSEQSEGIRHPRLPENAVTPWPYAFVHRDTIEYQIVNGGLEETRDALKGFGFAVAGRITLDGEAFYQTATGHLIPTADSHIARNISSFAGIDLTTNDSWPVGFVNSSLAWAYRTHKKAKRDRIGAVSRYSPFAVLEVKGFGNGAMFRFDENAWLSARDVRVARPAEKPSGLTEGEKWIDVDTKTQIITAYEGTKPVYVTMASTGRGGPSKTVKGTFRIWAKIAAIAMDNTDDKEEQIDYLPYLEGDEMLSERKGYSLQDVPWAQFFYESYALHGVYWHDRFGNRKSHGCVNLSPRDAKWFFDWTAPKLPAGFWALHSSPGDKGTLVRVR